MAVAAPTVQEIFSVLEDYNIDTVSQITFTADVALNDTLTNVAVTGGFTTIKIGAVISGAGIPTGTTVTAKDPILNTVTMSNAGTAAASTVTITHRSYSIVSSGWVIDHMNNFVIPWMEKKTRQSFYTTTQEEEIYSGNGTTTLVLNRRPVISVEQIRYLVRETYYGAVDVTLIEVIGNEGIIRSLETTSIETTAVPIFPKGKYNIAVTYTYGYANLPEMLQTAIKFFVCESILGQIADRTGGGNISTQGWNRNWGERGKYTNIRNDLARKGLVAMQEYMTGVVG